MTSPVQQPSASTISLKDAQNYFALLKEQAHSLFSLVSDFSAVFPDDMNRLNRANDWKQAASRSDVLNAVSSLFFQSLNRMMHESYILHVARLADPASTRVGGVERLNLTIPGMQQHLIALNRSTSEIEIEAASICTHIAASAREPRNRIIAHSDLETHQLQTTLGGASDEDTQDFLQRVQRYLDLAAIAVDLEPSHLSGAAPGDAYDLMRALEWAYQIRNICVDSECPFQKYDIRPVRGAQLKPPSPA